MKNINWNDFKTTLIEHDKHYVFTFEEIEKEAYKQTQKEDLDNEFETRLLSNQNTLLRNRDRKMNFIMIKTYFTLIGESVEDVEKNYYDCFVYRVKELKPDIPDEHIEVYRKTINLFEMMEYCIGMDKDCLEEEAQFFVFIHNFGIFDLYDSRKRKKRRSKTK